MKPKKNPVIAIPANTSKFLRLTKSQIDIKELVKEDIEDDFVKHEANKMRYYDLNYNLKPIEGDYAYLEDVPFNSMHKISDAKVKKRIMRLLQKPERNELEIDVLKNISTKQGKLLSEINYEFDNEIISSSAKLIGTSQDSSAFPMMNKKKMVMETIIGYKNENESKIVENLDQWAIEKIKRGNKKQKKEEQILREAKTLEPNTPLLTRRSSVVKKVAPMINLRKSVFASEKTEEKSPSPNGVDHRWRKASAQDIDKSVTDGTPASRNTDEGEQTQKVQFGRRTLSFAASGMMPRSVTMISLKKRHKSHKKKEENRKEGFVVLPNFDNLEEMLNNDKAEQNLLKALNTETNSKSGIASIIKEMMEMKANEESSVIQSAIFYEKQNRVIEAKLMKIMKDIEGVINNKQATIRSLRIENAKISKKMGYISKYLNYQPQRNEKPVDNRRATLANMSSFMLYRGNTLDEASLTQEQKDMKESLKLFRKKFEMNNNELTKLEEEAQFKKKELKSVLNSKKKFLLEILQKGVDVRDQGLIWIIKTLGSDGVNVTLDDLPPFLDSRSKSYLFMRARMEIELNELQTLRKTIIEIYRASTDGEENADAQNIFESMFQVGEFDWKKAENKTPSQITLLNASMRSTQNLFLPSLNTSVTGISVNLNLHRDSRFLSSAHGSFYGLNHSRNYSQPHLQAFNSSFSLTNVTHHPDMTNNGWPHSQNMQSIQERNSQGSDSSNKNADLDLSDLKKSKFNNNQRKLVPQKRKDSVSQGIKKPTGLSEFLSMHMTSELNDDDEKPESKSTYSSHSSESDSDAPSDEAKNAGQQVENAVQEKEPMSYQAQLITSLYYPMPEYPHDKNYFTVNEKMYRMTKDSIYTLIKNLENKESLNYRDEENNRDKIENRLKIYEGNTLLNDYENRTQFIEKVESLQKQIEALEQYMKNEEDVEAERMFNEFRHKNYRKRFNTEITIVIPAIFGAHKGEKILIRYGLIRNSLKKKTS